MSYLGFKIGMPQIELILSNTNSYPGLIHMFCNALGWVKTTEQSDRNRELLSMAAPFSVALM